MLFCDKSCKKRSLGFRVYDLGFRVYLFLMLFCDKSCKKGRTSKKSSIVVFSSLYASQSLSCFGIFLHCRKRV